MIIPELPEVETIRRQLLPHLPALVVDMNVSPVVSSILKTEMFSPVGKTLIDINRVGKVMDFIFDDGNHIISGLGMSGAWRFDKQYITEKHTHIQFECQNSEGQIFIAYVDPRRFGKCHFLDEVEAMKKLDALGVDISSDQFTSEYVLTLCKRFPNKEIKPFMLEQKYFAGIGNYIASEVCAHASILPTRLAGSLTNKECKGIVSGVKLVLSGSLEKRGLTFSGGHTDATGKKGDALDNLVVFHQSVCGICEKTKVIKIEMKGRGTFYCPACQK